MMWGFVAMAVMVGVVVFGGTTLAYFQEQRRPVPARVATDDQPATSPEVARRPAERSAA